MNRLGITLKPSDVNPDGYVVVYFAGGHCGIWVDTPDDERRTFMSTGACT